MALPLVMFNINWRIATLKDGTGRRYFVRGMTADLERVTLWGELTRYSGTEGLDGLVHGLKIRCAEGVTVNREMVDVVEGRPTAFNLRQMINQARQAQRRTS